MVGATYIDAATKKEVGATLSSGMSCRSPFAPFSTAVSHNWIFKETNSYKHIYACVDIV
jgi:hypothetical protein